MFADTILKTEELPEVEKFAMLIKETNDEQQDMMRLVIQSINLGIAIGKGEVLCKERLQQ